MTTSRESSSWRAWTPAVFALLYLVYGVAIAVAFWRALYGVPAGDERVLPDWLGMWRDQSALASMSQGLPAGYLAPVSWLARFVGGLVAGRLLSAVSILLLGASVWWLSTRLGAGRLGRQVALLAFLNMVLAGHTFFFNAIADPFFTLLMFWVITAVAVAVVERRMGLAILAGTGWAFAWEVRPLAPVFTLAILGGLSVLVLRDRERGRSSRYALAAALTAGCGVLLAQAPALRASGTLAFEKKMSDPDLQRQRRFLSILRHDDQHGLGGWLWVPLVNESETRRYLAEHGADSLPRSRADAWRRAPFSKVYQFAISIGLRTTYYLAALAGLLFPLAWLARGRSPETKYASYVAFGGTVTVLYLVLINAIASPFIEWRWFMLPAVALICGGAVALERLLETRRAVGLALLTVQMLFMCASCAIWVHRVAIGYPPRGSF
jgi:hypothetical protein